MVMRKDEMNNLYLFDCFGVVVTDVSGVWMDAHFDEQEKAYIRANFFRAVDTGAISQQQLYEQFAARYNMTVDQIVGEWERYLEVKWDTIRLIRRLHDAGGTVALLSNAAASYVHYIFDKFDLTKYFDKMFVSSLYGVAKPDADLYRICIDSFEQKFDNIYFTDDNPVNLVNLEQFGITPILFTTAAELATKLKIQ